MGVVVAAAPGGMPAPVNVETSPLSGTVESFLIENGTMEEGLSVLRRTNTTKILIGFERLLGDGTKKKEPYQCRL
jgi:hypothetical protein